jgi:hypothetical protein
MFSRQKLHRLLLLFLVLALLALPLFAMAVGGTGAMAAESHSTGLEIESTGGGWAFPLGDCNGGSGGSCGGG